MYFLVMDETGIQNHVISGDTKRQVIFRKHLITRKVILKHLFICFLASPFSNDSTRGERCFIFQVPLSYFPFLNIFFYLLLFFLSPSMVQEEAVASFPKSPSSIFFPFYNHIFSFPFYCSCCYSIHFFFLFVNRDPFKVPLIHFLVYFYISSYDIIDFVVCLKTSIASFEHLISRRSPHLGISS